jgi:hypothetical protein
MSAQTNQTVRRLDSLTPLNLPVENQLRAKSSLPASFRPRPQNS